MENHEDDYLTQTPALKMAYRQGQLSMVEMIREMANTILIQSQLNPFNVQNDYQEGQMCILSSILEACMGLEKNLTKPTANNVFDA